MNKGKAPLPSYIEYDRERIELAKTHAEKNKKGKPIIITHNGRQTYDIFIRDEEGDPIDPYMDNDVSVITGMLHSFYDAPFGEEMQEINIAGGLEYWYDKQFAIRGGYFHESGQKGNRQYFTLGAGLKYNVFGLDFSYLISTNPNNPLKNTLRFTLSYEL